MRTKNDLEQWQTERQKKYFEALSSFPSRGQGAHLALYRTAIFGFRAGYTSAQIEADLNNSSCARVPPREVSVQVAAASSFEGSRPLGGARAARRSRPRRQRKPIIASSPGRFDFIAAKGAGTTSYDLMLESPAPVLGLSGGRQAATLMETMYRPEEFVFCGRHREAGKLGRNIRPAAEWATCFKSLRPKELPPFIIMNPLDGQEKPKASGQGTTLRGKNNIAAFRYALLEFDDPECQPLKKQAAFFRAAQLELAALVYTGGKSLHGWLRVHGVFNAAEWDRKVKERFFGEVAGPLGADDSCKDSCRLARLPGAHRSEKASNQVLLHLNPALGFSIEGDSK